MRKRDPAAAPELARRLSAELVGARTKRHMTVVQMADDIGISESALRRLENLSSHYVRLDTWVLILAWAKRRGYYEFAGRPIERKDAHAAG